MFSLEDFRDKPTIEPIIIKLNRLFDKNKTAKITKIVEELELFLDDDDLVVPITYILSILAENSIEYIQDDLLPKIEPFLQSKEEKLKINSIIIIGFKMLSNFKLVEKYFPDCMGLLVDESEDIKYNGFFFIGEIIKKNQV